MMATKKLPVAILQLYTFFSTIEINGYQRLFGYQHASKKNLKKIIHTGLE